MKIRLRMAPVRLGVQCDHCGRWQVIGILIVPTLEWIVRKMLSETEQRNGVTIDQFSGTYIGVCCNGKLERGGERAASRGRGAGMGSVVESSGGNRSERYRYWLAALALRWPFKR
jgi:hypothetical protein